MLRARLAAGAGGGPRVGETELAALDAVRLTSCGRSDSRASTRATSCEDGDHRIGPGGF